MTVRFILVTHTPLGPPQTPNPTLRGKRNVETPYRSPEGDSLPQGKNSGSMCHLHCENP